MKRTFWLIGIATVLVLALTLGAWAAVKSPVAPVENPEATSPLPEVVEQEITVVDKDGKSLGTVELSTVALADAKDIPDPVQQEAFREAYQEIRNTEDLSELKFAEEDYDLSTALEDAGSEAKPEDLIVRYFFHASVEGDLAKKLTAENAKNARKAAKDGKTEYVSIPVTFKMDLPKDETVVVMVFTADGWVVINADDVTIDEDGNLTVNLPVLGPIAILTEKNQ